LVFKKNGFWGIILVIKLNNFMLNIYTQKSGNQNNSELPGQKAAPNMPKPNFGRYTDPTQEFSTKEFKQALWFTTNRVLLYRLAVGLLIGLSAIFWLFVLVKGANLAMFSLEKGSTLDRDLAYFYDYTTLHPAYSAQPLLIAGTQILSGGVKKYDLLGEVSNPNPRFRVEFDYYFIVDGVQTQVWHSFLLAGESRILTSLGFSQSEFPGSADLVVTNLSWHRISNHEIVDVAAWQADRLNFQVSDFAFARSESGAIASANVIKFNLKNNSAYSFVEPYFEVGLYQGETLVGILPLRLSRFKSGETRAIDLRSFVAGLNVTSVKIFPLIDIYDQSVYLPPES